MHKALLLYTLVCSSKHWSTQICNGFLNYILVEINRFPQVYTGFFEYTLDCIYITFSSSILWFRYIGWLSYTLVCSTVYWLKYVDLLKLKHEHWFM